MGINTDNSDACTAFNVIDNNFGNIVNSPSSGASTTTTPTTPAVLNSVVPAATSDSFSPASQAASLGAQPSTLLPTSGAQDASSVLQDVEEQLQQILSELQSLVGGSGGTSTPSGVSGGSGLTPSGTSGGIGASSAGVVGASTAGGIGASSAGVMGASTTGGVGASSAGVMGASTSGGVGASSAGVMGASTAGGVGASSTGTIASVTSGGSGSSTGVVGSGTADCSGCSGAWATGSGTSGGVGASSTGTTLATSGGVGASSIGTLGAGTSGSLGASSTGVIPSGTSVSSTSGNGSSNTGNSSSQSGVSVSTQTSPTASLSTFSTDFGYAKLNGDYNPGLGNTNLRDAIGTAVRSGDRALFNTVSSEIRGSVPGDNMTQAVLSTQLANIASTTSWQPGGDKAALVKDIGLQAGAMVPGDWNTSNAAGDIQKFVNNFTSGSSGTWMQQDANQVLADSAHPSAQQTALDNMMSQAVAYAKGGQNAGVNPQSVTITSAPSDNVYNFTQGDITKAATSNPPDFKCLASCLMNWGASLGGGDWASASSPDKMRALVDKLSANPPDPTGIGQALATFTGDAVQGDASPSKTGPYNDIVAGVVQALQTSGMSQSDAQAFNRSGL